MGKRKQSTVYAVVRGDRLRTVSKAEKHDGWEDELTHSGRVNHARLANDLRTMLRTRSKTLRVVALEVIAGAA